MSSAQALSIKHQIKVDVLVTETFDAGLLGEHVLESLAHAWQNFLTLGHSRHD